MTNAGSPPSRVTWGLDMSTSPKKTAAVALEWTRHGARIAEVHHPLRAADIADLIGSTAPATWAVDVPFGWPDQFVALLTDRHEQPLPAHRVPPVGEREKWRTREVAQRLTDRLLTEHPDIKTRPLPASFQLLGATAASWTLIEAELHDAGTPVDRAGLEGRVCETYPSAVLAAWGAPKGIGKHTWPALQGRFPFLKCGGDLMHLLASDDVCDAVVCAMAARARDLGLTVRPEPAELAAARREGWIHVSLADPRQLLQPQ